MAAACSPPIPSEPISWRTAVLAAARSATLPSIRRSTSATASPTVTRSVLRKMTTRLIGSPAAISTGSEWISLTQHIMSAVVSASAWYSLAA
jgi:hypothetical protein